MSSGTSGIAWKDPGRDRQGGPGARSAEQRRPVRRAERLVLPGFPDSQSQNAILPAPSDPAGTSWYRTAFQLNVPTADDASLGITIGDPSHPRSGGDRALLFVNGWNMGQYIGNVGPQHTFVVPNGVLNPKGQNTIAIAVTSDGGRGTAWSG